MVWVWSGQDVISGSGNSQMHDGDYGRTLSSKKCNACVGAGAQGAVQWGELGVR